MKNIFLLVIACLIISCSKNKNFPQPNDGTIILKGHEESENKNKKKEWFDLIHQAEEGTDWRAIELKNSQQRHALKSKLRLEKSGGDCSEIESYADGALEGKWFEKGSKNQAGSVFVTEYDPDSDVIYTISAGGTLWSSPRDGSNWQVINQDLRFSNDLLKFINLPNGERRLLASIERVPHFSDDDGFTWTASTGVSYNDSWGNYKYPIVVNNDSNTIYLIAKPTYWTNLSLYKSSDHGESYQIIKVLDDSSTGKFALSQPHGSDQVFMIERRADATLLFQINQQDDFLEELSRNQDFIIGEKNVKLTSIQIDSITRFITYDKEDRVHYSDNYGNDWVATGVIPENPWDVGIYVSPSDPQLLIAGGLHLYRSYNAGQDWFLMNQWWDYYNDVENKIHADIMKFTEFQTNDGEDFILVSNHGGLSVSYDNLQSIKNISLSGLNVSQYYSVVTDRRDPIYIYAGSQDQGFQRGVSIFEDDIVDFDQVISGDYGHNVFSNDNRHLWTVYPGGSVSLYRNPRFDGPSANWQLDSDNESVWIPPLMESPDSSADEVYLAGGNIEGGKGSYIIKLSFDGSQINASQLPFDFYDYSGSAVSTMATSPLNKDKWYAATTDGLFYYSENAGITWEQHIEFLPSGHYLYGSSILASKRDNNTVYVGGSGYSNPPVYKSTDGGKTFKSVSEGLPSTLVFKIVANEDESLLFAATESGPFVYVVDEEIWYDLSGTCAPSQTYWSVEFVAKTNTVRFGTYGRGIWDFVINNNPLSINENSIANSNFKVFPNPSDGIINIDLELSSNEELFLEIFDLSGKLLLKDKIQSNGAGNYSKTINTGSLKNGMYTIRVYGQSINLTEKVIIK